ncbi:MAG: ribosome small subunit-dependent GTPase A, partial [Hyphomicrobiaceae bacterium]
ISLAALGWTDERQSVFAPHAAEGLIAGRVVGEHRTHYQVGVATTELSATLAGRLRNDARQRSDLAGVGDFVAIRPSPGDGPATIEAVLPRTSALVRKAAGEKRPQLLAANVDVIFIVMALDGDFNLPRLERYLALVHASGARPVIVANKTDLAADLASRMADIATVAPGVAVHAITARAAADTRQLEAYFDGNRTIALIGSSGVGKSTLTNRLLGREAQATQEVRSHDDRGRHTTTHRQLFLRPHGGAIMDTPGMRGLEMWDSEDNVAPDFSDIEALALECKFRNCQHGSEPKCAVRAAVDRGELDAARVATFNARVVTPHWVKR